MNRTTAEFNGKGTIRGEPEMRDCIELQPVDISKAPPLFWPREVSKIVLLSATIGPKDIEALGLNRKRVLYIDCESPIPAERRPIQLLDVVSVSRGNMTEAAALLATEIEAIANHHHREKGVIHATYQMSNLLSKHLTGDRYMFHDRDNKKKQYEAFRAADPTDGAILIACGMYEGVDLPEDLGRWQVISKIPWMSLGNPAIRHLAELDPEWYNWETIKTLVQACGRICRTPTDYGITYVLDTSVQRIFREAEYMLPRWWLDAILSRQG
jgi:Rad3-related DNA helicase